MALSKNETIFLSSAGDVVICRCRKSHQPQHLHSSTETKSIVSANTVCCEMESVTGEAQQSSFCAPWGSSPSPPSEPATYNIPNPRRSRKSQGGLLGGSPASVAAAPVQAHSMQTYHKNSPSSPTDNRPPKPFQSQPLTNLANGFDDGSIVPIKSFDYSHYNIMDDENISSRRKPFSVSSEREDEKKSDLEDVVKSSPMTPNTIHGVPTFLSKLSQVKMMQVSAHSLGSHVLFIAEAGLLYAYGSNSHGQLGLGTTPSGSELFISTPTIVTPLIEHGGKTITCAAGENHSLVAVMTEERRLVRSQTQPLLEPPSPSSLRGNEAVLHHQLYGFGKNDFMKIGLVSPKVSTNASGEDEMENVTVPRRVALRCRVPLHWQPPGNGLTSPKPGIFAIAASSSHSAALVHRSSGDVELYTWGSAMHGALGLPQQPIASSSGDSEDVSTTVNVVPVPSFVASMSRSSDTEASTLSLMMRHYGEYPASLSLGPQSTFVTTSMGRAFSFGFSEEGMLGLGNQVRQAQEPQELSISSGTDKIVSISAGTTHTVAVGSSGSLYSWGSMPHKYTTIANSISSGQHDLLNTSIVKPPRPSWTPEKVDIPPSRQQDARWKSVVAASAGYDSLALVVDTGHVLSYGKASGRLGLGETAENVSSPQPLFGGFRLWYQNKSTSRLTAAENQGQDGSNTMTASRIELPRAKLVRGSTFS